MLDRHRGRRRPRPPRAVQGRHGVLRAVVGGGPGRPGRRRGGRRAHIDATVLFWRNWLARARIPDHPLRHPLERSALTIKGLTYMPTGATVAALTTSLPETPGRRAQLGLPLHLDARHDVHPPGAALPEPRLGGRRVHAVRRRPRAEPGRRPADHVRHRRPARPHRVDARRAVGLRGRPTRCGSATAPSTSARTTCSARSSTRCSCTPGAASTCHGGCGRSCSRRRQAPSPPGASPTRASGRPAAKPQHYVSSKLMGWVALDRAAKLAAIRDDDELEKRVGRRRPRRSRRTSSRTA